MIKVNGIMKLNPEYTKWKKMQESGGGQPEAQIAVTGMSIWRIMAHVYFDHDFCVGQDLLDIPCNKKG